MGRVYPRLYAKGLEIIKFFSLIPCLSIFLLPKLTWRGQGKKSKYVKSCPLCPHCLCYRIYWAEAHGRHPLGRARQRATVLPDALFLYGKGGGNLRYTDEWAANRDSDGIVYCFADGTTQVIRMDDYLRGNPEYTATDFRRIKALSDELFCEQSQSESQYQSKRSDADFDSVAATLPAPDPEPCLEAIRREQRRLVVRAALTLLHSGRLSPVQRRRFVAYFLQNKTVSEIARNERVRHQTISESVSSLGNILGQFV